MTRRRSGAVAWRVLRWLLLVAFVTFFLSRCWRC